MPQASLLRYFAGVPTTSRQFTNKVSRDQGDGHQEVSGSVTPTLTEEVVFVLTEDLLASSTPGPSHLVTTTTGGGGGGGADDDDDCKDSLRHQPPNASVSKVEAQHLPSIKRLTSTLLPIRYPDAFFAEVIHDSIVADLSRVILVDMKPVGWIRCRLDHWLDEPLPSAQESPRNQIYIQALCLLAPYRGQGLAAKLLDSLCQASLVATYNVQNVYAHVWEDNEEALQWYEKRGFQQIVLVEKYYRRLKPAGAWVVRRDLR